MDQICQPAYLIFNPLHDNFEYISYKLNRLERNLIINDKTQKLYNLKIAELRNKIIFLKNIKINLKRRKIKHLL